MHRHITHVYGTCISKYKKNVFAKQEENRKTTILLIQLYIKKIFPKKNKHFIDSAVAQYWQARANHSTVT